MNPLIYFDLAAKQFTTHGGHLLKLEGKINAAGATDLFVQVHDSQVTPAEGSAPKKSWPTSGGSTFFKLFDVGELQLVNGLYVVVSSTEATLTTGTGSDKFSTVAAEIREVEPTVTVAGDLTTNRATLQVWAEASGPKRLKKLQITPGSALTRYHMLFAKDSPQLGDTPVALLATTNSTSPLVFEFGKGGIEVQAMDAATLRKGCTIAVSLTSPTFTVAQSSHKIRAEYI